MTPISSLHNPRVKQLRALRSRRERDETGRFFIEGAQLVAAAAEQRAAIELLVVAPALLRSRFGQEVARELGRGLPTFEVTPEVLRSIAGRDDVQGLGAVVCQRWRRLDQLAAASCRVALDGVQYPGNLGTILRTSDATGGAGVVLLGPTADPHDPLAVRASTGAIFGQELARASPAELARWARGGGVAVVGAAPDATLDYRAVRYPARLLVAMGSEGQGLSGEVRELCDTLVRIPMVGRADSLNLAIATGLVLYEVFRQQRPLESAAS
jgi:RNA methyltransferase, TrmH family